MSVDRTRTAFAALSGVLLALSFPRYGHPAVAFGALVPLLVAVSGWTGTDPVMPGVPAARGFRLGLVAGVLHFAGTVYWTGPTIQTFGGLAWPVAMLVTFLLVLYMAAYVAIFAAMAALFIRRFALGGLALAPAVWVSTEYLRGVVLGGFPWIPLGNTMVTFLPIAQLASVTGVYGLSAFVALVNAGVATVMIRPRLRAIAVAGTVMLVAGVSIWGGLRLADNQLVRTGIPVRVGLIQGNVPQDEKWDPARAPAIVSRYLRLTEQALAAGAELVIWPESSTPFFFDEDPAAAEIREIVRQSGRPLLLGSDEFDPGPPRRLYNSAFMLDRAGGTAAVYRKIHLVPFGEYVPFQRLLFFVAPLVEAVSAFSPGEIVTMLPANERMMSAAICYEVTYPALMREAVRQGSELLATITNDAWYGRSSAAFQHFEMAAMRAIEGGRYLVRAANTGVTGIVDPYGRVTARTALFETVAVVGEARFVQASTPYARMGDVIVFAAMGLVGLALLVLLRRS
jgi:apolipoprotein N-acyltransferase